MPLFQEKSLELQHANSNMTGGGGGAKKLYKSTSKIEILLIKTM